MTDEAISLIADSFDEFLTQFSEDENERKSKQTRQSWYDPIASGDLAAVEDWLNEGGDINDKDSNFNTPIYLAVVEEQPQVVDLLLDRGLPQTQALDAAADNADWSLMKRIVQRSKGKPVDMNPHVFQFALCDCDDVTVIEALLDAGAPLHATFQRGNALYHATESVADPTIVKLLLERGAEPGVPGHMKRLPLTNAICSGKLEAAKVLMDAGENLYFQPKSEDEFSRKQQLGPLECLSLGLKPIRAIKSEILQYARILGQTEDNDAPLAR